jgi:hypothetical protein
MGAKASSGQAHSRAAAHDPAADLGASYRIWLDLHVRHAQRFLIVVAYALVLLEPSQLLTRCQLVMLLVTQSSLELALHLLQQLHLQHQRRLNLLELQFQLQSQRLVHLALFRRHLVQAHLLQVPI